MTTDSDSPRLRPAIAHGETEHSHGDWIIPNEKCPFAECPMSSAPAVSDPTKPNHVDLVIVGTWPVTEQGYFQIGYLTPDLVLPDYLQSLEQTRGYFDVHVARQTTTYERLDLNTAESERSVYPDQHRHMAKTTRRVQQ